MTEGKSSAAELERYRTWVPPGHFYSPLPDLEYVSRNSARIFDRSPRALPGVDLNEAGQLKMLTTLASFYSELPFPDEPSSGFRYHYRNPNYSYSDAIVLYAMIRHAQPQRIIEVGSGYSSCVTLDTNDRFFDAGIDCTFIEPFPELLRSLLWEQDRDRINLIQKPLQEVDTAALESLAANDILFVDSTHVSKVDSDVNHLLFRILPSLQQGVLIHFHDIFYPFEYPQHWLSEGRAWNEDYLLRAFLQYNREFEVVYFTHMINELHEPEVAAAMPLCLKNKGGSLWLRRR